MPISSNIRACHGRVEGRVQGVSFRYSMQQQAHRCGVTGWVRNTRDGAVEFTVQGSSQAVEALLGWARRGPEGASVDGFNAHDVDPDADASRFEIRV